MFKSSPVAGVIIMSLCATASFADQQLAGTKGQNYDKIAFEIATDDAVEVVAKIMTINRHPDSSSTLVVTDNGAPVIGPATDGAERWRRSVAIKGKGRHELVMICTNANAEPVYCALDADESRVSMLK